MTMKRQTYRMVGDPTEGALIVAAAKAGAHLKELSAAYPRVQEVPFDSERKRMITIHKIENPRAEDISPFYNETHKDWYAITVKGAPDMVLDLCQRYQRMDDHVAPLDEHQKMQILAANDQMTQEALRVLGMAYRITPELPDISDPEKLEQDLVFAGLTGMIDPPRLGSAAGAGKRQEGRHPDSDDHRRLRQHCSSDRRIDRTAESRSPGAFWSRPE